MVLDESKLKKFWNFIQTHQSFSYINSLASRERIQTSAYIVRELNKSDNNYVKKIYNAWVSQGKPPSYAVRMSIARVTPSIPGPSRRSSSTGHGVTKRKKKRKPRKKKSVKKRKETSKKKRVRRKRKSRRRS